MNDELLVSFLLEEGSDEVRDKVTRWIAASPANQRYFEHFRLIWETSRNIILPASVDENDAWKRFQQRTAGAARQTAIVRPIKSSFHWMRIAAILILTAGAAGLSYFLWDRAASSQVTFASAASAAEKTLPDGSVVTLNKHSEITYAGRFKGAQRKIKLKGEAFFKVTPDKSKPFIVTVNDVTVTVVGTSFNIKSFHGRTEVVVETGIVEVTRNNKTVTLSPHQRATTAPGDSAIETRTSQDQLYNYYRSKEFVCDNTPLWKLVETLNEAYDAKIVITNTDIRSYPLTTTFYNEPLDNILSVISETFNITVERRGEEILLK